MHAVLNAKYFQLKRHSYCCFLALYVNSTTISCKWVIRTVSGLCLDLRVRWNSSIFGLTTSEKHPRKITSWMPLGEVSLRSYCTVTARKKLGKSPVFDGARLTEKLHRSKGTVPRLQIHLHVDLDSQLQLITTCPTEADAYTALLCHWHRHNTIATS